MKYPTEDMITYHHHKGLEKYHLDPEVVVDTKSIIIATVEINFMIKLDIVVVRSCSCCCRKESVL